MATIINEKILGNLEELARLKLKTEGKEKTLKDLEKILEYFEELKELDVEGILPMTGGTFSKNVFREDKIDKNHLSRESAVKQFPETQDGFLKVPPVFE
ncbi:MAG: Asp-tRNA(Asn)/Glu-tRNA(Gln) amidotransferase subunit GatC [Patescibacteria group bacterium]